MDDTGFVGLNCVQKYIRWVGSLVKLITYKSGKIEI